MLSETDVLTVVILIHVKNSLCLYPNLESVPDITTMAPQWVYAAGNCWVPFDYVTNSAIERLWRVGADGNLNVGGYLAYINTAGLYMLQHNTKRTITRTGC
ncbi:hypothetical protein BDB00DRAFT_939880 [Zychaea mexicana]|uniref:uncharacterized protein n=1 Tax=Zychaea mexicana TaxID=64656 RepID=UPI0022FDFDDB|nr:uncharacterized protein BDB00DRAFT_939880 [Zychaea mexicana]KAI9492081.1 hypothetical protein BDB00DRAFT_939880 [Zychaea mexicana]